jgi:hypothetical protein
MVSGGLGVEGTVASFILPRTVSGKQKRQDIKKNPQQQQIIMAIKGEK